ncbi:MAG: response regulator [Gemmatimonadales bacterium]
MGNTILLVDDDPDIRLVLGEFLTEHGFDVQSARDGRHALQLLAHMDSPDLILLDYKMPVMSGIQFLARRRWNPRLRGIPVVVLSAWNRQWTGSRVDALEVLSKPVDLERLLALVQRACDGSVTSRTTDRRRADAVAQRYHLARSPDRRARRAP